jgi:hypothetical protein
VVDPDIEHLGYRGPGIGKPAQARCLGSEEVTRRIGTVFTEFA